MLHPKIRGSRSAFSYYARFLGMSDGWKTLGSQFVEQGYRVYASGFAEITGAVFTRMI